MGVRVKALLGLCRSVVLWVQAVRGGRRGGRRVSHSGYLRGGRYGGHSMTVFIAVLRLRSWLLWR